FVDVNTAMSLSKDEILGKSVEPKLSEEINMKLKNQLDYLTERSFWQALKTFYKRDIVLILLCLFCGMGIWEIIRTILKAAGVNLP
ncbi:MAG: hypothetical protein NZ942_02745, partial [Candidatus Aenigmarchaeota archaeon]|nr:hypothetical protein [Candidatus Aenigmarchaeota archaeon]